MSFRTARNKPTVSISHRSEVKEREQIGRQGKRLRDRQGVEDINRVYRLLLSPYESGWLFTYTHEVGISSSTDEVTEDAEELLLEAIVDVRRGPKRPAVGLRTRGRRAKAAATPGSSSFLFSMAV